MMDKTVDMCKWAERKVTRYALRRTGDTCQKWDVISSLSLYRASDLQNKVASQCLQLHGGWGYMWEYPIAKWVTVAISKVLTRDALWNTWLWLVSRDIEQLFIWLSGFVSGLLWTLECSPSTEEPTRSWRNSSHAILLVKNKPVCLVPPNDINSL